MPSRFESRFAAYGLPVLNREHSVSVTYSRVGVFSAAINVRRTNRQYEAMGAEIGVDITVERRNYWIAIADLVLNGITVVPRAGDIITEGSNQWVAHFPDDSSPVATKVNENEWLIYTKAAE